MPIELHCPQCEKLIRAPDNAGGKHGKCPYCDTKVYIPVPFADDDLLALAPVDEEEERRAERERQEALRYTTAMDKDSDLKVAPPDDAAGPRSAGRRPDAPGEVIEVGELAERFVLAMRDSKLEDADRIARQLKRAGSRARDHIEGMLLDPTPPPIEGVPKPLVHGFLKALLERL
jgi:hypothetical protein